MQSPYWLKSYSEPYWLKAMRSPYWLKSYLEPYWLKSYAESLSAEKLQGALYWLEKNADFFLTCPH